MLAAQEVRLDFITRTATAKKTRQNHCGVALGQADRPGPRSRALDSEWTDRSQM
jgi:hypothetical protein